MIFRICAKTRKGLKRYQVVRLGSIGIRRYRKIKANANPYTEEDAGYFWRRRHDKAWLTSHSVYRMWVTAMIDQANAFVKSLDEETRKEIKEDGDLIWIDGYDSLFEILNEIITTSPAFNTTVMVGTPMNGLLAVAMATEAGLALFHDTTFNLQFKKVLDAWNTYLKSSDSLDKLDVNDLEKEGSWISKAA